MEPDVPSEQSPPEPSPPEPSPPAFQMLRSRQDRKLGGVAGGLAAAADLDPTLVRLAIVLGCLTGWGILAYLIAWAIIPDEDPAAGRHLVAAPERTGKHLRVGLAVVAGLGVLHVVGTVLGILSSALIGLGLFPARLFGLHASSGFDAGEALLGLVLLIGGCLLLFRRHLPWMPAGDGGPDSGAWFSPSHWRASGPAGAGPFGAGPFGAGPSAGSTALATITPGSGGSGATAGGYIPPAPPSAPAPGFGARASAAARAARTNVPLLLVRALGWLALLWFLAAAALGGVFWATGALHVHLPVLPIVTGIAALGALGYTLVRTRRLALVFGAMALLLVPTAIAGALTRVDGQAGNRSVTPTVAADLERQYRHAAGSLNLDLSALRLPAGETPVHISMGAGKIDVTVPWDAEVRATASVGAGSFDLFGNHQTGVNLKGKTHSAGQPGAVLLVITGRAGAGEVIVRRGFEPFTQQALRTGQPVPMTCTLGGPPRYAFGPALAGPLRCTAADGATVTPALGCVVAEYGAALCRPVGEPEPAVDFANSPGTRHCQVPAGGGESTCTAPVAGRTPSPDTVCTFPPGGGPAVCRPADAGPDGTNPGPPPAPPATTAPPAAPGEYRCTIPEGGGPATCEPA